MAESPKKILEIFGDKLNRLISESRRLENENKVLENRLAAQQQVCDELQTKLAEAETKYKNLTMARELSLGEGADQEAKARFAKLVREIDKCISLLNE
ncbi:MAG: hypothetical protein ACLRRG_00225 [Barnesiella sp.]